MFAGPRFALLYRRWLTEDDAALTAVSPLIAEALASGRAQVEYVVHPHPYSTARRGQTVESLHVNLQRGESKQNFSIWVYGDEKLVRGSGLFVPMEGVAFNHHFLLPEDGTDFRLLAGDYALRVFAKKVSVNTPEELASVHCGSPTRTRVISKTRTPASTSIGDRISRLTSAH